MSTRPPEGDDPEPFGSVEDFVEACKDPEFSKLLKDQFRKVLNGELGDMNPELRESARQALEKHSILEKLQACQEKLEEFQALMRRPGGTMRAEERMGEARRIMDEAVDLGLELPEPYRTDFLKDVAKVREEVRGIDC